MFTSSALESIQLQLGYTFANIELLEAALTHSSYGTPHYQRLEFLGDAVLGCAMARILFERYPHLNEGNLTRLRANLISERGLVVVATRLGLHEIVRVGEVGQTNFSDSLNSIIADSTEGILGAIFLDANFDAVYLAVNRLYQLSLDDIDPNKTLDVPKDPKTRLQEYTQQSHLPLPRYTVIAVSGEIHRRHYRVSCTLESHDVVCYGEGSTKREAEQTAALLVWRDISNTLLIP